MRFLKLSKTIINTSNIGYIKMYDDSYRIFTKSIGVEGYNICWFGFIHSDPLYHDVDKKKHPEDYEKVTKFIENIHDDFGDSFNK